MRKLLSLVLTLKAFLLCCVVVTDCCLDGWSYYNRYCYYFSSQLSGWDAAEQDCVSKGSHLVSVWDEDEKIFLLFSKKPTQSFWIGIQGPNKYWTDGTEALCDYRSIPSGSAAAFFYLLPNQTTLLVNSKNQQLAHTCKRLEECEVMNATNASPNATVGSKIHVGDSLNYRCSAGHEIVKGTENVVTSCQPGGNLTLNETVACTIKECNVSTAINTTRTPTDAVVTYGTVVTYTCNQGHMFPFNAFVYNAICIENSVSAADCGATKCDVIRVNFATHNASGPIISYGVTLNYTCESGYQYPDMSTTQTVTCLNGTLFVPHCEKIVVPPEGLKVWEVATICTGGAALAALGGTLAILQKKGKLCKTPKNRTVTPSQDNNPYETVEDKRDGIILDVFTPPWAMVPPETPSMEAPVENGLTILVEES